MDRLIKLFFDKKIHIVGVTGAEGSGILRFLIKHNFKNISAHDFGNRDLVEKSYKLWHKGLLPATRKKMYNQFLSDLSKTDFYCGSHYLENIENADIIFVPQSWRLYKNENRKLFSAQDKKIPFYSLTRLYLDFSKALIVGVTGTVGKGSSANILKYIIQYAGKKVLFGGNDTWMLQELDEIMKLGKNDVLVLEVSHRQLLEGFTRAPHIVLFTNLYPNHLDEMSWKKYKNIKLSLLTKQTSDGYAVVNYDSHKLRSEIVNIKSKIIYFSEKYRKMNIKSIQKIYNQISNINNTQYLQNMLSASTCASLIGINNTTILNALKDVPTPKARMELIYKIGKINFYDDVKSTSPWATIKAIDKLKNDIYLICGGDTKNINYNDFIGKLKQKVKKTYILKSELSKYIINKKTNINYEITDDLESAIKDAYKKAEREADIVISPAAAFFYSYFIKNKKSINKIVTSLPPKD